MAFKNRYLKGKEKLLSDTGICTENQSIYKQFFEEQEYKLQRINNLRKLDDGCYCTLYQYVNRFKNVNLWFKNKPLSQLTFEDIKSVYDGLEDGKIKTADGKPFKARQDYYSKVFKSRLFEIAGVDDLAKKVIQYQKPNPKEVRFISEADFRKIVAKANKPQHKLLLWLAWDIGENITSLLELKKSDFYRQENPHTHEPEYRVTLRQETLKRSRRQRTEITNYQETVELLTEYLEGLQEADVLLFSTLGYPYAKKLMNRLAVQSGVVCIPTKDRVTWKDLRSGMACDLLKKGWTTDEVNARLGHKPSSDEIDKYVNFLAIDRHEPKKKVQEFTVKKLQTDLEKSKEREKLMASRLGSMQSELSSLSEKFSMVFGFIESQFPDAEFDMKVGADGKKELVLKKEE